MCPKIFSRKTNINFFLLLRFPNVTSVFYVCVFPMAMYKIPKLPLKFIGTKQIHYKLSIRVFCLTDSADGTFMACLQCWYDVDVIIEIST